MIQKRRTKKMKKTTRRLMSLLLALGMALTLAVPVMAQELSPEPTAALTQDVAPDQSPESSGEESTVPPAEQSPDAAPAASENTAPSQEEALSSPAQEGSEDPAQEGDAVAPAAENSGGNFFQRVPRECSFPNIFMGERGSVERYEIQRFAVFVEFDGKAFLPHRGAILNEVLGVKVNAVNVVVVNGKRSGNVRIGRLLVRIAYGEQGNLYGIGISGGSLYQVECISRDVLASQFCHQCFLVIVPQFDNFGRIRIQRLIGLKVLQ
jgi:hypothetical protein